MPNHKADNLLTFEEKYKINNEQLGEGASSTVKSCSLRRRANFAAKKFKS